MDFLKIPLFKKICSMFFNVSLTGLKKYLFSLEILFLCNNPSFIFLCKDLISRLAKTVDKCGEGEEEGFKSQLIIDQMSRIFH